jgi:hypothetical protein
MWFDNSKILVTSLSVILLLICTRKHVNNVYYKTSSKKFSKTRFEGEGLRNVGEFFIKGNFTQVWEKFNKSDQIKSNQIVINWEQLIMSLCFKYLLNLLFFERSSISESSLSLENIWEISQMQMLGYLLNSHFWNNDKWF